MARYIVNFVHRIMDRLVTNSCRKELKLAAFRNKLACDDMICTLQAHHRQQIASAMKGEHE